MTQRERIFNLPPVIVTLGAILILIHVIRLFLPERLDEWVVLAFSFIPVRYAGAASELPGGGWGEIWTPLTYAFLHGGTLHIAVNLVWMASFGSPLARRFGAARFLILSAVAALAGALAHYLTFPQGIDPVVGASAAISGMMSATARFAFAAGGPLFRIGSDESYRYPAPSFRAMLVNRQAMTFLIIWLVLNILFGTQLGLVPGSDQPVAWQAHIGGFIAGLLLFPLLDPIRRGEPPAEDALAP
ncbi:Membrane associated serine protease, rhomboid family [Faunimonas pinastri]|uniref:Membrane associated serine protease, rhomboid family n=2 Tax=Faunimonas pinastri TaxID=1855383 RepID=A0A1H9DAP5_9HYPH|nr:Membrane associated serine protease, rhomboid family [Faunimonas pinastri]